MGIGLDNHMKMEHIGMGHLHMEMGLLTHGNGTFNTWEWDF